jgi:tetratricopeptide (TPR) repeat protein
VPEETTPVSLLDELEETALRSRLEFFMVVHDVKPAYLAKEAAISRQHLLRVRKGTMEPTRLKIAQIVSALRRLTLLNVQPNDVFELSIEENGTWALAAIREEVSAQAEKFRIEMRLTAARIAQVLQQPQDEWADRFSQQPISEPLLRQLVLTAHRALDDKPRRAIAIHALAARLSRSLPNFVDPNVRIALIGRTFLDRAFALRHLGRFPEAFRMLDRAEEFFRSTPYCIHELAQAWYERAAVHFRTGEDDPAAVLAKQARSVYTLTTDRRRAAKARMLEACILVDARKFRPARDAFRESLAAFKAFGDQESLGSAYLNLGNTEMHLGRLTSARNSMLHALRIFTKLELRGEIIRVRWNLAHLDTFHGDADKGFALLRQARADFANLRMPAEAARVGLDIVKALFGNDAAAREAATLARTIVTEFENSGATRNAVEALAYLRDALARGKATPQLVDDVGRFVDRAPRHTDAIFTPSS